MDRKTPAELANEIYQKALQAVVDDFDTQIAITNPETFKKIIGCIYGKYTSTRISYFFVGSCLKDLTEEIFMDPILRDFVLDLTDRVNLSWSILNLDYEGDFLDRVTKALLRGRPTWSEESSLINKETQSTIAMSEEFLRRCLADNVWLTVFYFLLVNFHETSAYKLIEAEKK